MRNLGQLRAGIAMATAGAIALTGCMSAGTDGLASAGGDRAAMICNADAVQSHIGHEATEAMGSTIRAQSGARTLRWGPPRSAWTMDYRQDRVNVQYDDNMKITAITCG
jgi:hypothetical protein